MQGVAAPESHLDILQSAKRYAVVAFHNLLIMIKKGIWMRDGSVVKTDFARIPLWEK